MVVFKFGGASVKSVEAVRNIVDILERYRDQHIVVVVSAMGKTTNALERIIESYTAGNGEILEMEVDQLAAYHHQIMDGLFKDNDHPVYKAVKGLLKALSKRVAKAPTLNFDYDYDQLICYGEMLSTTIIIWI